MVKLLIFFAMILPAQAAELKVLSWNTFMLPYPIKKSHQKVRTDAIANALKGDDYDFIFMQEAFMDSFRNKVGGALKADFPHQYYLAGKGTLYPFFGSGVFVLGRHPFKVLDKVYYNKCGAADCWAAKGAVLVESTLPSGKTVQFAVTHLQAKESLGSVRLSQLDQVKGLLSRYKKAGVPQLFIGDLNIDAKEEEFHKGLNKMKMNATELTGEFDYTTVIECYKKPTHEKEWIDHMWVDREVQLKDAAISVRPIDYTFQGKTCMASDHHAIEGFFTFAD